MSSPTLTLLDIGEPTRSLLVRVTAQPKHGRDDTWYDTVIEVEAFPFRGELHTVFTLGDLREWARQLSALDVEARAVLGGGRAAELVISADPQIGGRDEALTVEVGITPSGDDPYPMLTYVLWDVPPTAWRQVVASIAALA
ncbi:MAG: DUF5959 family protein [Sporichthyaceae bacterium]